MWHILFKLSFISHLYHNYIVDSNHDRHAICESETIWTYVIRLHLLNFILIWNAKIWVFDIKSSRNEYPNFSSGKKKLQHTADEMSTVPLYSTLGRNMLKLKEENIDVELSKPLFLSLILVRFFKIALKINKIWCFHICNDNPWLMLVGHVMLVTVPIKNSWKVLFILL